MLLEGFGEVEQVVVAHGEGGGGGLFPVSAHQLGGAVQPIGAQIGSGGGADPTGEEVGKITPIQIQPLGNGAHGDPVANSE